ncbi:hypothetical protein CAAN1_17S02828 [[Candida] anglica]|uniref:RNA helicase n=1 Tax=[Candida] anglica TaxID=148631 RepID=A0ABP0EBR7_9ASCO
MFITKAISKCKPQSRWYSTSSVVKHELRPYQRDAIQAVHEAIKRGVRRPAVVLATGGGKTVVFSHLIPQLKSETPSRRKTLVLAHTQELIFQAARLIKATNPNLIVQVDMSSWKPNMDEADVIVASVPTLVRMTRLERYDKHQFKTIILDECHHATASSWTKILNYFDAGDSSSPVTVVGFTATMERADGMPLGKVFDEIVYQRGLVEMVKNKELVDVKFTTLDVDVDFSKVKSKRNDFDQASLSNAMNTDEINSVVAGAFLRLKQEYDFKSTLVFCIDIAHCKTLCAALQSRGVNAQYVTGDTVKDERNSILDDFKNGRIDVLCNVMVFTEGTDIPNIDSLILARPTKSRPLLIQMIGRGLRLHPGKENCHVVDIAGTRSTGIQSVPTLFGVEDPNGNKTKNYELNDSDLTDRQLQKEEQRKLQEKALVAKLALEESRAEAMNIAFSTVDGFAELIANNVQEYASGESVNSKIRESNLAWVRLEYDVWGVSIPMSNQFFTLTRVSRENCPALFELRLVEFASYAQIQASGKMCPRQRVHGVLHSDQNLDYILIRAETFSRQYAGKYPNTALKFNRGSPKPVSDKQIKAYGTKLVSKAKKLYTLDTDQIKQFRASLTAMNSYRFNDLILALKYSINSLHVRWELQKLLGFTDKEKRMINRYSKKKEADRFLVGSRESGLVGGMNKLKL